MEKLGVKAPKNIGGLKESQARKYWVINGIGFDVMLNKELLPENSEFHAVIWRWPAQNQRLFRTGGGPSFGGGSWEQYLLLLQSCWPMVLRLGSGFGPLDLVLQGSVQLPYSFQTQKNIFWPQFWGFWLPGGWFFQVWSVEEPPPRVINCNTGSRRRYLFTTHPSQGNLRRPEFFMAGPEGDAWKGWGVGADGCPGANPQLRGIFASELFGTSHGSQTLVEMWSFRHCSSAEGTDPPVAAGLSSRVGNVFFFLILDDRLSFGPKGWPRASLGLKRVQPPKKCRKTLSLTFWLFWQF